MANVGTSQSRLNFNCAGRTGSPSLVALMLNLIAFQLGKSRAQVP
jgi:hypothetical protein